VVAVAVALVAAVGVAAAIVRSVGDAGDERSRAAASDGTGPPVRPGFAKGANVTAYSADALAAPEATAALRALRATGADHVAFPVLWFQETRRSTSVLPDAHETPSDASLLAAAQVARSLGMTVAFAPHVNVRDGTFRGELAPSDRTAWFTSYRTMVEHYADLAARAGATSYVVGSELVSLSGDEAAWRALIDAARTRFRGRLTYAANWVQEAESVRFWDALDEVGIDAYMPLTPGDPDPTVAQLRAAWEPWLARMRAVGARTGRPVVLTEVGYTSRLGTAQEPARERDGAISQEAQARAYEAAFEAIGHRDWITGAYVWDWSADGRTDAGDYSPQGKTAQAVLTRWYGG